MSKKQSKTKGLFTNLNAKLRKKLFLKVLTNWRSHKVSLGLMGLVVPDDQKTDLELVKFMLSYF